MTLQYFQGSHQMKFLRYRVTPKGFSTHPKKAQTLLQW